MLFALIPAIVLSGIALLVFSAALSDEERGLRTLLRVPQHLWSYRELRQVRRHIVLLQGGCLLLTVIFLSSIGYLLYWGFFG